MLGGGLGSSILYIIINKPLYLGGKGGFVFYQMWVGFSLYTSLLVCSVVAAGHSDVFVGLPCV